MLFLSYISQLIRFVRVFSNVDDFNIRNLLLAARAVAQLEVFFSSDYL